MGISVLRIAKYLLVVFVFISQCVHANEDITKEALTQIKALVMIDDEDAISPLIETFEQMQIPCCTIEEKKRYLFNSIRLQSFGNQITEFIDTVNLLFSFYPDDYQLQFKAQWQQAIYILDSFRKRINEVVHTHHPGLQLDAQDLRRSYSGKGITIAVFDLFDKELLSQQQTVYPFSKIDNIHLFGNPVSLSHGNSVIDIILTIAPEATIIPISSDNQSYNQAMHYLTARDDIAIINMSRTFLEKKKKLDQQFKELFSELLKSKIITKSLGNTGTDIDGNLTSLREEKGLPPAGNLFAYDLALIKEFMQAGNNTENLLLALNLNLMQDNIALSATTPGNNPTIISHTISVPAEGIYTWSTDNYESGSSFAAPQLAGITALLWQAMQESRKNPTAQVISKALRANTKPIDKALVSVVGLGLVSAQKAWMALDNQCGLPPL